MWGLWEIAKTFPQNHEPRWGQEIEVIFLYSCLSLLRMFVCLFTLRANSSAARHISHISRSLFVYTSQCFRSLQTGFTKQRESNVFSLQFIENSVQDGRDLWIRLFSAGSHLFKAQCRGINIAGNNNNSKIFQGGSSGAFKATVRAQYQPVCCILLCQHKGSCSQEEPGLTLDCSPTYRVRHRAWRDERRAACSEALCSLSVYSQ